MPEFRFDSYCGLYCGACDILQSYKKAVEAGTDPQLSWYGSSCITCTDEQENENPDFKH